MRPSWAWVLAMPSLGFMAVAATCPPGTLWQVEAFGYDVMSYHLQIPRQWQQAGAMVELEHNVYSYLPGLIESAFFFIATLRGSVFDAVYTCQLFSLTMAVVAALAIAVAVATISVRGAGVWAAAVFISVPWILITGSMAYNETSMLAFGTVAVALLLGGGGLTCAVKIGLLVGAATLAKPTAGPMLAVPILLLLLVRPLWQQAAAHIRPACSGELRQGVWLRGALTATAIGLLILAPYLARNATWTGNPLFPFAHSIFGFGHWNDELAARWDQAHHVSINGSQRVDALLRQWLTNSGYGAWGGRPTMPETDNVARFPTEHGVPVLWLATAIGGIVAVASRRARGPAIAMGSLLLFQLMFWTSTTHLQSRFLIPTLIPGCILIGLGLGVMVRVLSAKFTWAAAFLVMILAIKSLMTFWSQTVTVHTTLGPRPIAVYQIIDAMDHLFDVHPINGLAPNSKTLLIADNTALLYLRRPIGYSSAFDECPLGSLLRRWSDPGQITAALHKAGYSHVYIGWSELERLHRTYGFDPDVTTAALKRLIAHGWRPVNPQAGRPQLFSLGPAPT